MLEQLYLIYDTIQARISQASLFLLLRTTERLNNNFFSIKYFVKNQTRSSLAAAGEDSRVRKCHLSTVIAFTVVVKCNILASFLYYEVVVS